MPATQQCPRCGGQSAAPFVVGGVCLRCAGEHLIELENAIDTEGSGNGSYGDFGGAADEGLPERIGPYEIIEELGRGGMGRVFAARQVGLGRIVAVKALADTAAGGAGIEMRFMREAQTAARLRHPNIVAIHDMGRASGYRYFSMDYIEGGDLAGLLRVRHLAPREAAELLRKVAEAVAYAHTQGVLHRDIKPSNILLDAEEPKIADFGLAAEIEAGANLTNATILMGTPQYLAPEALRGGSRALSVASDIYAIGIVLFEILTGRTPFAGAPLADLPRLVGTVEPPMPRLLSPAVPRDLETVCLKCIEKEPAARYADAQALADDLGRFVRGEPVAATRPGRLQAAVRYARRHRTGVAAGAAIALTLVLATAVSTAMAVRSSRAERRAATAALASKELSQFLQKDVLAQAGPNEQPDRDLKIRTALDNASAGIEGRFSQEPLVEADIRMTLATTYMELGTYAPAEKHLRRVVVLRIANLGRDNEDTLKAMDQLGLVLFFEGKIKEAQVLDLETIATAERVLGPSNSLLLAAINNLTAVYIQEGKLKDAEANGLRGVDIARHLAETEPEVLAAYNNLSSVYFSEERYAEAEPYDRKAYDLAARNNGPEHPDTLIVLSNLVSVYWAQGKYAQSEEGNKKVLAARTRRIGAEHPDTLLSMHNLATTYYQEGKASEAAQMELKCLEARRKVLGPEALATYSSMNALAADYLDLDRLAEAHELASGAYEGLRAHFGPEHAYALKTAITLARVLEKQGRYAEAEALVRGVLETRRQRQGPDAAQTLAVERSLSEVLLEEGLWREAEALCRHSDKAGTKALADANEAFANRVRLGEALVGQGRFNEAEPIELKAYAGLRAGLDRAMGRERQEVPRAARGLSDLYRAWGRPSEAKAWAEKARADTAWASGQGPRT